MTLTKLQASLYCCVEESTRLCLCLIDRKLVGIDLITYYSVSYFATPLLFSRESLAMRLLKLDTFFLRELVKAD